MQYLAEERYLAFATVFLRGLSLRHLGVTLLLLDLRLMSPDEMNVRRDTVLTFLVVRFLDAGLALGSAALSSASSSCGALVRPT